MGAQHTKYLDTQPTSPGRGRDRYLSVQPRRNHVKLLAAAVLVTVLPFALANADRPPPHHPPKAAFDACASARRGDACNVRFGDHSIDGTCEAFPDTSALVCRPLHPPGPPPEAVDACRSAKEGDACSFSLGDHAVSGTCARGPDAAAPLACRPEGAPPHPPH